MERALGVEVRMFFHVCSEPPILPDGNKTKPGTLRFIGLFPAIPNQKGPFTVLALTWFLHRNDILLPPIWIQEAETCHCSSC